MQNTALLQYQASSDIKKIGLKLGSLNFLDTPLNSNSRCYYYINKVHPETSIGSKEYHTTIVISVFDLELGQIVMF